MTETFSRTNGHAETGIGRLAVYSCYGHSDVKSNNISVIFAETAANHAWHMAYDFVFSQLLQNIRYSLSQDTYNTSNLLSHITYSLIFINGF